MVSCEVVSLSGFLSSESLSEVKKKKLKSVNDAQHE